MKRKVRVEWVFARKPKPIATVKAEDGHALPTGRHELRPEGVPVQRIWCCLCRRYFPGWREVFRYHKVARASGRGGSKRTQSMDFHTRPSHASRTLAPTEPSLSDEGTEDTALR